MKTQVFFKIYNKTTSDKEHLCKTCESGIFIRKTNNRIITYCQQLSENITSNVAECNRYYNKSLPKLRDLYETAWILETKKAGREIGFKRYMDWKRDHPDEEQKIEYGFE